MAKSSLFSGVRVVGFDLDQTLYPKSPAIDEKIQQYLYEQIAEHREVDLKTAKRLFTERYREGAGLSGSQTLADLGIPRARELVQEALERADIASVLSPEPTVIRFLERLKTRYKGVDLITGSDIDQTKKKLRALGIRPAVFTHLITASEFSKSNGDAFRAWLAKYPGQPPEAFLYVGDRVRTDHEVPSGLGIKTVLIYVKKPQLEVEALQLPAFTSLAELL